MKKHWLYLRYILIHKWYVFQECCKYGLYWQGIVHDWQKFTPTEWTPYVLSFYGPWKYKERPDWLHHQHYGPHHWQYWLLREDDDNAKVLEMPIEYAKEMIADWRGARELLLEKTIPENGILKIKIIYLFISILEIL